MAFIFLTITIFVWTRRELNSEDLGYQASNVPTGPLTRLSETHEPYRRCNKRWFSIY